MQITKKTLATIAELVAEDIRAAMKIKGTEMIDAIRVLKTESIGEKAPKFSFSVGVSIDCCTSKVETSFSYSVRTSVKQGHDLEDPDQLVLFPEHSDTED